MTESKVTTARNIQMMKEAKRVAHRIGAESCIVIGIFREGDKLRFADVGGFPMPPAQFYQFMTKAHHNLEDEQSEAHH